jgi:hypothetical protein
VSFRTHSATIVTAAVGVAVAAAAFVVYWLSNRMFDAGRGDFFYLADSFLHGHPWLDVILGPNDIINFGGHVYVPFAPFPAILLMPLVAVIGPITADQWETGINAGLAATVVLLSWWVAGRIGVLRLRDRLALAVLLGFSTQVWWVTTRGGVWHTGHLIAMILTLLLLAEMFGRQRAFLMGLLVGLAFLTRAPVAFAAPSVALWLVAGDRLLPAGTRDVSTWLRGLPWRAWILLAAGLAPSVLFFLWYNIVRFGDPLQSGYALATVPDWLEQIREQGLFSLSHLGMNFDYLFLKVPAQIPDFPYFRPDGLGMSVFITSPGLLLAVLAPWRDRRAWWLLLAAVLVLIPTLLYYGGGWLQYGYRYFLDSIPFVWALVAMAIARRGRMWWWAWLLIGWGVLVGLGGVYWAYNLH